MLIFVIILGFSLILIGSVIWAALWSWAAGVDPRSLLEVIVPPMVLMLLSALGAAAVSGALYTDANVRWVARGALGIALVLVILALAWPALHLYAGWTLLR